MGFALPWALLGLAAAALPVLIHLMRRRDLRDVPLPTIALLHRARAESRRRLRLVDVLLLAARMGLLALLAVALAQPYVNVTLAWGDGSVASAAVVLDDSMSMARRADGSPLLDEAVARAREAIEALPEGSEVTLVLAGKPARPVVEHTTDRRAALARLEQVEPTARGTDLSAAVARATRELSAARHPTRRLLVLSDFARHATVEPTSWPQDDVEVRVDRIGGDAPVPNRAIGEVIIAPDPTTPGRASIRTTIRGFGEDADGEVRVRVRHRDEELAAGSTQIQDGVGRLVLHAPWVEDGDPTAQLEIEGGDALQGDDARGALLREPSGARLLLVNGDPHSSRQHDELTFLAEALDVAPRESGAIRYRIVDADTLSAKALDKVDVIVLANVPPPDPTLVQRLEHFVERGGGLVVTGGDNVVSRAYASRLSELLPTHPGPATRAETPVSFAEGDADDGPPWVDGLRQARTTQRLLLDPPRSGARTLLAFEDGAPALVMGERGHGRVALLATTVDDDWTDLPYRPGFVPLVLRLVKELAPAASMPDRAFEPGERVEVAVAPGARRVRIVDPGGQVHDFDHDDLDRTLSFDATDLPGAYRVRSATDHRALEDDTRAAFVVAPPVEESDLTPGELPARGRTAGAEGSDSTVRRPLAPWLYLMAALLVALEALLRSRRVGFRWTRGRETEASGA